MGEDKTKKLEYRVRFDASGTVLGESSRSPLSQALRFSRPLEPGAEIFALIDDTAALAPDLPGKLRPLVERLLHDHDEFALSGDFECDGQRRHLRISGQAIRNVNGEYTHTLLFLDDTVHTELRRSYEYMFRLANHEIKGPLAVIMAAAEYAGDHVRDGNTEGVSTCLRLIENNARAVEEMISRYLDLSRIESGSIRPVYEKLVFSQDILNPIIAEMQLPLARKSMTVDFATIGLDAEPAIEGARELIEIVVRNLLSNAVKYGDAGTRIKVTISLDAAEYTVSVENAGPNIPQEYLTRLFQRFMRLDATGGTKGSGLGLYNARKLVEMWGGTIAVESGEHETRFRFTVPCQPKAPQG